MRLPELDFGRFLGFGTENLPHLGILNRKLGNFVIFGENGDLVDQKNVEKGVLSL